ncbi:MAG: aspartate--tRNA ligase, partial [Flavobacteriales bacterium]|nr:aspartate--tRNA ligase [Flavobacteriales bacterium]
MLRSHTCGELRIEHTGQAVMLCGWVQRVRTLGGMTFVDLRDRYGITQLAFNETRNSDLTTAAANLGREFVISAKGEVIARESKNTHLPTGEIELNVTHFEVLNNSLTSPFTIETDTDGVEEMRIKYRYLDLRRTP